MEYKVGDRYVVGLEGREKGNVIEITRAENWPGRCKGYNYRAVQGKEMLTGFFMSGSSFANSLFPVYDSESKILITSDGHVTTARLYDGKKVTKTAEAKCSPDDKFDFATGAKLVFDRLMGKEKPKEDKPEPVKLYCVKDYEGWLTNGSVYSSSKYMLDFIKENPIPFRVSNHCCTCCKKNIAHSVQKNFDMVITGERRDEGGMRSVPRKDNTAMCFAETGDGKYRLRPLYYVSDADKQWYKEYYGIRYSDAYEVYGLTRTGCCGCSISSKAVEDLEKIRPYEPNLVKAAWNVFGESYIYRQRYNEYKARRQREVKEEEDQMQISLFAATNKEALS